MKVLMINSVCGIGSTGRICTDVAYVLQENGHECKIAYGRASVKEQHQSLAIKVGSDLGVRFNALKSRLFDNDGFNAKRATKKLIKQIKDFNPDVIHLHNLHGYYLNIKILFDYLKQANKPVVWTLHDCWAITGHCSHFDYIGCEKWKEQCFNCPQKKEYPKSIILDCSKKNHKKKKECYCGLKNLTIVTPSKWLGDIVAQSCLKNCTIKVINNGIDLNVFKPTQNEFRKEYQLENKKIVLGVASSWTQKKGINDFIKLSEKLTSDYQVVMIGLSQAQIQTLPENIIKIQRTDSAVDLARWYSVADVFVNTTYEDTYPTVNLEAQACGTPVVTYRTGGSVESAIEEYVVERGNIENLCQMIENVCAVNNKKLNTEIEYDAKATFKKYVKLYEEVVKK